MKASGGEFQSDSEDDSDGPYGDGGEVSSETVSIMMKTAAVKTSTEVVERVRGSIL